jgi:hypothetical protein
MRILASSLIRLVLITLIFHKVSFSQYEVFEAFDPEKTLPESDLVILNNAKALHQSLTPESAFLLSQLSFLSHEEVHALGQVSTGELNNLDHYQRLKMLSEELWKGKNELNIQGSFIHRINRTEGVHYKWFGDLNFEQFRIGLFGERDAEEINILDHYSVFLKTKYQDYDYTIGNFQMLVGHGLISWRSMSVKSDFGSINSALRRGRGIQPFRSGHESWAYRGLGWQQPMGRGQLSAGISHRKIDGSIENNHINISNVGLHVSDTQIKNRGNISETIGIADWETTIPNGIAGFVVGGGAWTDNNKDHFTNLASSVYGNYKVSNLTLFSELAVTSQNKNAIIGGGRMKHDSFYYGIVFRKIDNDYFALRDNGFRNWNNKEFGETGVLQELRFQFDKIKVNVYSDMFRRLEKSKGEFKRNGYETGISLEQKFNPTLWIQTKLKIQEASSENYGYVDYNFSSVPVSTFKTTIKWKHDRNHSFQCQLQEKHNQNGSPSSWGVQLRSKHSLNHWSVKWYWVTVKIEGRSWLYYWDVNLPGEMKSKVFTRHGHYLGNVVSYQTSSRSEIHLRISTAWQTWDFDVFPIVRGALQINISI